MFKLRCLNADLAQKLAHPDRYYSPQQCQELSPVLERLRHEGEIARAEFFLGHINRISTPNLSVYYLANVSARDILIIEIAEKPRDPLPPSAEFDDWDDEAVIDYIPQYDKPTKLIRAVELIHSGVDQALDLGIQLGHRAEKPKDIARQGQYALKTLAALQLVTLERHGRMLKPVLTDRGHALATAPDRDTQEMALIGAMMAYEPIMVILEAVTADSRKLDIELIKERVFPPEFRDADTCHRRAQTLKTWVKWICHYQVLPIAVDDGVTQLPLPLLFAPAGSSVDPTPSGTP